MTEPSQTFPELTCGSEQFDESYLGRENAEPEAAREYRNAKKLLKLFLLLLFLFTSHIVKLHTFLYKIGQSRDTLTTDKTCMHD